MRQVKIAMALVKQGDKYLLQLRDGDPKIGAAGLTGCFGGKIDGNEDAASTASRELFEETNISIKPDQLRKIGTVKVQSDHQLESVSVVAEVFEAIINLEHRAEALEGKLVSMTKKEALAAINSLTPATKEVFKELI